MPEDQLITPEFLEGLPGIQSERVNLGLDGSYMQYYLMVIDHDIHLPQSLSVSFDDEPRYTNGFMVYLEIGDTHIVSIPLWNITTQARFLALYALLASKSVPTLWRDAIDRAKAAEAKLALVEGYGADQWRRGNTGKDPEEFDEWRKRVQPF